jgi:glycosyltransferase involved in cell wall biosynthesis
MISNVDVPPVYSVVVPFFNEQENVRPMYAQIVDAMDAVGEPYEMVFVNDGSTDKTAAVLEEIYAADDRVNVLTLRRNFGQTPALKAGFDFARGDVIISMDGDLQNDPSDIPRFLEKIAEGYDLVTGWRMNRQDARVTRLLPSRIANWIIGRLSGVRLHDTGATFKAYRREVLEDLQLYGELHRFIPALASWSGASIVEIPIKHHARRHGLSKYGLSRTIRVIFDVIIVKFLLDYSTRPLHFFGRVGLLGTAAGSAIGVFLLYKKLILGQSILLQHGPLIFLGVLLIFSGIQFLSIGLIGELVARTYYESQRKPIYRLRSVKSRRDATRAAGASGSDRDLVADPVKGRASTRPV